MNGNESKWEFFTRTPGKPSRRASALGSWAALCLMSSAVACSGNGFEDCSATRTCPKDEDLGEAGAPAENAEVAQESDNAGGSAGAASAAGRDIEACDGTCSGKECCDDGCVDLDGDVENCGACGHVCEFDQATRSCEDGVCVMGECQDGFLDCNGEPADGCELTDTGVPEVPVLLAPMIGAYTGSLHAHAVTGSLKPSFSWQPVEPAGCGSVSYQLEVDDDCTLTDYRSCDFPEPEVDARDLVEARFQPDHDLPVEEVPPVGRRYYWRVRACDALERCSDFSPVHYVDVGRIKQDVTGDGYADLVALAYDEVAIAHGGPSFGGGGEVELARLATVTSTDFERLHFLGDVNGDGFADLGATTGRNQGERQVLVFLGGPTLSAPISLSPERDPSGTAYATLTPTGDFDNDGLADFLIGVSWSVSEPDWVAFYRGASDFSESVTSEHLWEAQSPTLSSGYAQQSAMGDYDANGFVDFAIALPTDNLIEVRLGGPDPDLEPDALLPFSSDSEDTPCSIFGGLVSLDMNGDGRDDLAALCDTGRASVYFGARELFSAASWATNLSAWDLAAGDIDGDGFDDLLVSGPEFYPGAETPLSVPAASAFAGDLGTVEQRVTLADHNGDGNLDMAVGNQWYAGDGTFTVKRAADILASDGSEPASTSFTSFAR